MSKNVTQADTDTAWHALRDQPDIVARQANLSKMAAHFANCRLAYTARPDAGDDKAEIERLRGLLIDPGSPPWEDARAVLVTELRKSGFDRHADYVEAVHGCMIPSDIVLNLIAQAARRPDAGDEDVERVARALRVEDLRGRGLFEGVIAQDQDEWPDWSPMARAALAAMRGAS